MMKNYKYWKSDSYPNYLVREKDGIFEDYRQGRGWKENSERCDIVSGIDPWYTEISETEAGEIIARM